MRELIKYCSANVLSLFSAYPTRVTSKERVEGLIDKLKPISISAELIRFGGERDGGYLIPDDLEGIETCFSPGVNQISEFEKQCAAKGMNIFMADFSVDHAADEDALFHFTKKYIGVTTDSVFMTLDDWVVNSVESKESELLLQIDIEGFEYEVFLAASEALLKRFRIIVIEFHQLDHLWSEPFFNIASRAFEKILQTHSCVHIHPNNCCGSLKKNGLEIPRVMEMTFLRHDRVEEKGNALSFPHVLDEDNQKKASLVLPKCWY